MAKLCISLDTDKEKALKIINSLKGKDLVFKVSHPLYLQNPEILKLIKELNFKLFLDLKLFDIPNTVKLTIKECEKLKVDYLTLHLLGGREMIEEALKVKGNVKLIGVGALTSFSQENLSFFNFKGLKEMTLKLIEFGSSLGLDGFVCPGAFLEEVRERVKGKILVVPGIRERVKPFDQKFTLTLKEAKEKGGDLLVVGREVLLSEEPVRRVEELLSKI